MKTMQEAYDYMRRIGSYCPEYYSESGNGNIFRYYADVVSGNEIKDMYQLKLIIKKDLERTMKLNDSSQTFLHEEKDLKDLFNALFRK